MLPVCCCRYACSYGLDFANRSLFSAGKFDSTPLVRYIAQDRLLRSNFPCASLWLDAHTLITLGQVFTGH
ncbi:MAG: hypothetical protein ABL921_12895 [Pirellula sp.]